MSNQSVAWVDGVWYDDAAQASVSVLDHGLLYGDGVFEGIRFYAATPFLLEAHLRRLRASARCLMIDVPLDDAEFAELFSEAIARFGAAGRLPAADRDARAGPAWRFAAHVRAARRRS